jgi:hypothetical protein
LEAIIRRGRDIFNECFAMRRQDEPRRAFESGANMRIRCVKLQEQGIDFFVALVKEDVVNAEEQARRTVTNYESVLNCPVVLCGDLSGKYFGRHDLAHFLARTVHPSRIRWGTFQLDYPD